MVAMEQAGFTKRILLLKEHSPERTMLQHAQLSTHTFFSRPHLRFNTAASSARLILGKD